MESGNLFARGMIGIVSLQLQEFFKKQPDKHMSLNAKQIHLPKMWPVLRLTIMVFAGFFLSAIRGFGQSQADWEITVTDIDPSKYFGTTVANGMI